MSIILTNVYQSELITLMISPSNDNQIKTFEELAASDHQFITDKYFKLYLNSTGDYPEILAKMTNISRSVIDDMPCQEIANQKIVYINPCGDFDYKYFDLVMNKEHVKYLYMMQERILPYYRVFTVSPVNPYLERWQYYMDWSFTGGLQQHWETEFSLSIVTKHGIKNTEEEDIYLSFSDLDQTFYLLLIGLLASLIIFILEILSRFFTLNIFLRVYAAHMNVPPTMA